MQAWRGMWVEKRQAIRIASSDEDAEIPCPLKGVVGSRSRNSTV
jgi:hypothetical protein